MYILWEALQVTNKKNKCEIIDVYFLLKQQNSKVVFKSLTVWQNIKYVKLNLFRSQQQPKIEATRIIQSQIFEQFMLKNLLLLFSSGLDSCFVLNHFSVLDGTGSNISVFWNAYVMLLLGAMPQVVKIQNIFLWVSNNWQGDHYLLVLAEFFF